MTCANCGERVEASARVCPYCVRPLSNVEPAEQITFGPDGFEQTPPLELPPSQSRSTGVGGAGPSDELMLEVGPPPIPADHRKPEAPVADRARRQRPQSKRWPIVFAAVLGLAAAAAPFAVRTFQSSPAPSPFVDIVDVQVGECFDLPQDLGTVAEVEEADIVACGEPHHFEMVAAGLVGDEHPVGPVVDATDQCRVIGTDYLDLSLIPSDLEIVVFVPLDDAFANGDRAFRCAVYSRSGDAVSGSWRASD